MTKSNEAQTLNLNMKQVDDAYKLALQYMHECEGLEPTSAFKQAASDIENPIPEGKELRCFCLIAHDRLDDMIKRHKVKVRG